MEAAIAKGRELPEWYLECDPPDPELGETFFFDAFWKLHTTRHLGMGMGPIPWDKIVEYGFLHDLDRDMLHAFIAIIMAMDTTYLQWQVEQADRTQGRGAGGQAPRKLTRKP